MLTKEQEKQVDYMNQAISNLKTDKQKEAIELSKLDKMKSLRNKLQEDLKKKSQSKEKELFINHLRAFVKVSEITEDMIEKETAFYID